MSGHSCLDPALSKTIPSEQERLAKDLLRPVVILQEGRAEAYCLVQQGSLPPPAQDLKSTDHTSLFLTLIPIGTWLSCYSLFISNASLSVASLSPFSLMSLQFFGINGPLSLLWFTYFHCFAVWKRESKICSFRGQKCEKVHIRGVRMWTHSSS